MRPLSAFYRVGRPKITFYPVRRLFDLVNPKRLAACAPHTFFDGAEKGAAVRFEVTQA
jgi:hypothetical protein